jgi:hypothetical protein
MFLSLNFGSTDMKRAKNISGTVASSNGTHLMSQADRAAAGKALRDKLPHEQHGIWKEFKGRPSPIDLLRKADVGRMKQLVPIRYGRMLEPPASRPRRRNVRPDVPA